LSAAVSLVGAYTLAIGAGGTLDLGGQTITPSGSGIGSYNFIGTAVSRATVIGNGGFFAAAGTKALLPHIEYCDFSDLIDSYLGRTQTSNLTVIMRYSTVTNCAAFYLDTTGVAANAGFIVEYCDFSDWRSPTAQPANDFQPGIYQNKLTSTAPRVLRHCTFDNSMNAVQGAVEFTTAGAIYEHNVFNDVLIEAPLGGSTDTYRFNFFSNTKYESPFFNSAHFYRNFYGNYVYYEQGNHAFSPNVSNQFNYIGNVFDNKDGTVGVNWFINGAAGAAGSMNIAHNLFLGKGNAVVQTVATQLGTIIMRNNTSMVDNDGSTGGGQSFPYWFMTEQAATDVSSMDVQLYSSLYFDPDDTDPITDPAVDLVTSTPDQLTYLDYNMGWSAPTGGQAIIYDDSVVQTGGVAPNDFTLDPSFTDRSRDVKTFDTLNGGNGTVANAITQMIARNPNYLPYKIVKYTHTGFQPQSTNAIGGRYGETVGSSALLKSVDVASVTISNAELLSLNSPQEFSEEAQNYFNRLNSAGDTTYTAYKQPLANYIDSLVTLGGAYWDDMGSAASFVGVGIQGVTVPLRDGMTVSTNNNFVAGDLDTLTGLKGDASTKYISTGVNATSLSLNDNSISVYLTESRDATNKRYMGNNTSANSIEILANPTGFRSKNFSSQLDINGTSVSSSGIIGISRDNSANYDWRYETSGNVANTSVSILGGTINVFQSSSAPTAARLATYHAGPALNLATLEGLQDTLITEIAAI